MSIAQNFPALKPSLNLDFANVKKLDPRVSFSRASGATYYDGKTVAKAEENLVLYSEQFNNVVWQKLNMSATADTTVAPDGTTTADTITTSSTSTCLIYQTVNLTVAETRTFSFYIKQGTANFAALTFTQSGTGTQYRAFVNLSTGATGTVSGSISDFTVTSVSNGFYRVSGSFSLGTAWVGVYLTDADNNLAVTSGVTAFLWGAQLEQRSAVTAYTPTTTQPITNYIPVLQTASANVARFDHDPVTGESLGLLVEEQRTNLVLRSEEFDDSYWSLVRATRQANVLIAPNGTLTTDKIIQQSGVTLTGGVSTPNITLSAGTYTWSTYAKAGEYEGLWVRKNGGTPSGGVYFNLSNGTISVTDSGFSGSINYVGNGWYRCSSTFTTTASETNTYLLQIVSSNGSATVATGDGYSGIYIWGAQLEAGAFPTSYIKTEASQVTRSADSASMTGTNFSEWYRADEGTLYAEGSMIFSNFPRLAMLSDGTFNNKIDLLATNATTMFGAVTVSGSDVLNQSVTATVTNSNKMALAYAVNNGATSVNASTPTTDTSMLVPVVSQLNIGASATANRANGHIRKLAFYPSRLSNEQLQALTS